VLLLCSCEVYLRKGPKVKEFIEDPFKYVTWLGCVYIGLRVRVQDTIAAYGYVNVTILLLALSFE
jgi:hypothetical protein